MHSGGRSRCRAGFVSARFGIASMRTSSSIRTATRCVIQSGRVAMIEMVGPVLTQLASYDERLPAAARLRNCGMERAPVNFSAGVEFIDENGGGPGVRLRKP